MIGDRISSLTDKIGMKTLHLVLLAIASAGIYLIVWLVERYKVFNEMAGKEIISKDFIATISILMGISGILASSLDYTLASFAFFINIAVGIMFIVAAFKISKAMEYFYAKNFKLDLKFNKFYLVIFHLFYIDYYINKLEEIERKESLLNKEES